MCGRYVMSKAAGDLLSHFEAKEIEGNPPPPSWNIAPTQDVPIIAERLDDDSADRRLLIARWGLVPSWAKDIKIGSRLINARSDSILDKPSEGYYEWQKTEDGKKIPHYLYSENEPVCQWPIVCAHGRPAKMPAGGHENCPLMATRSAHRVFGGVGHVGFWV